MLKTKDIVKNYYSGEVTTEVLKGINLEVPSGQFLSIVGPSGVGKSTLLYQMSLLDRPTSGQIFIDDELKSDLSESEKITFRLHNFGFVFQYHALIPEFTALENAILTSLMMGRSRKEAEKRAREVFESLGIKDLTTHLPSQLSGGEKQRAGIARAIVKSPKILFADEPTANLDSETSEQLMDVLKKVNKEGQTIIMVTHEESHAKKADRMIRLKKGKVYKDKKLKNN